MGGLSITTAGHTYSATAASARQVVSRSGLPGSDSWTADHVSAQGAVDAVPTGPLDYLYLGVVLNYGTKASESILPDIVGWSSIVSLYYNLYDEDFVDVIGGFNAVGELTSFGPAVAAVPLPAVLPLFATGLAGLIGVSWRRKRKAATAQHTN